MIETNNGLSVEFISHPGDTLAELMEQYGVSQKELSLKTQTSEKNKEVILNEAFAQNGKSKKHRASDAGEG